MLRIGHFFKVLDTVDSTNNYAMAQVHAGLAKHGFCYFAHHQTAGKGQRGKSWLTQAGENVSISVVIDPGRLLLSDQFLLSASAALSCYDFVKGYAGIETRVKWPNDIYWCDRKAGGILIENVVAGTRWQYAIVGIGLNINQTIFPTHLPNPVSLKQISNNHYDAEQMARELCYFFDNRYQQTQADKQATIIEDYNNVLYKRNETVKLRHKNILFDTVIKGVNIQGRLVTNQFVEKEYSSGEIQWVT